MSINKCESVMFYCTINKLIGQDRECLWDVVCLCMGCVYLWLGCHHSVTEWSYPEQIRNMPSRPLLHWKRLSYCPTIPLTSLLSHWADGPFQSTTHTYTAWTHYTQPLKHTIHISVNVFFPNTHIHAIWPLNEFWAMIFIQCSQSH